MSGVEIRDTREMQAKLTLLQIDDDQDFDDMTLTTINRLNNKSFNDKKMQSLLPQNNNFFNQNNKLTLDPKDRKDKQFSLKYDKNHSCRRQEVTSMLGIIRHNNRELKRSETKQNVSKQSLSKSKILHNTKSHEFPKLNSIKDVLRIKTNEIVLDQMGKKNSKKANSFKFMLVSEKNRKFGEQKGSLKNSFFRPSYAEKTNPLQFDEEAGKHPTSWADIREQEQKIRNIIKRKVHHKKLSEILLDPQKMSVDRNSQKAQS